ncbi:hypothetical protein THIOSC15_2410002 [uncultured Thiomicrorhabdus sp.]
MFSLPDNPNYHRLAYLLLSLTTLSWAGNFVLARAMHADIPPIGWLSGVGTVAVFIVPWAWQDLKKQWPIMKSHKDLCLPWEF